MHPWHHKIHSVEQNTDIPHENQMAWDLTLGQKFTIQRDNDPQDTSRTTLWDTLRMILSGSVISRMRLQHGKALKNFPVPLWLDEDVCMCRFAYCARFNVWAAYKFTTATESTLQIKGSKFRCSFTVIISLKTQALQVLSDYLHRPDASTATTSDFT